MRSGIGVECINKRKEEGCSNSIIICFGIFVTIVNVIVIVGL